MGQGQIISLGSNFDQHNFNISLFNMIFLNFMHYTASGAGADNPMGSFQATNQAITGLAICCKFQKNCFELWFYMLGKGQTTSLGYILSITGRFYYCNHVL